MNPLRSFEEFLSNGTVRRQRADAGRAKSLIEEAENRKKFLSEMLSKRDGFNASGGYAHEAEIAYLRNIGFTEGEVRFANDLRYFRNGIRKCCSSWKRFIRS